MRRRPIDLGRVLASTGWLTLERIVRMVVGLVVSVWLARYLGSEGFGTYSYVIASVLLFSEVATLGLNAILVRDLVTARGTPAEKEILGTASLLRVGGGILTVALAVALVTVLEPEGSTVQRLVTIFAVGFAFRVSDVIDFFYQARTRQRAVVGARLGSFALVTAGTVTAIYAEASLVVFVALRATEFALIAIGLLIAYPSLKGPPLMTWRFSGVRALGMLSRSWPLVLSGLSAVIYLKIDQIMLANMIGSSAVGVYAVAAQLSEVWYFLPQALCVAVFPSLLEARDRSQTLYQRRLQALFDTLAMGGLIVSAPIALLAQPIVGLLYGAEYSGAGTVLSIHIWASVFIFMRAGLSKWFVAEDLYVFSLVTHGAGAITNVLANLFLIPHYGPVGAAVATVASYAVASYFSLILHRRTWFALARMTAALASPVRWIVHGVPSLRDQ